MNPIRSTSTVLPAGIPIGPTIGTCTVMMSPPKKLAASNVKSGDAIETPESDNDNPPWVVTCERSTVPCTPATTVGRVSGGSGTTTSLEVKPITETQSWLACAAVTSQPPTAFTAKLATPDASVTASRVPKEPVICTSAPATGVPLVARRTV